MVSTSAQHVYEAFDDIDFRLPETAERAPHSTILLTKPRYFDVQYRINPYMGGDVDPERATEQWQALRECYERYAGAVCVFDPREIRETVEASTPEVTPPTALPDMVFCANHGVPTADGAGVMLSAMATRERADEPAYLREWCSQAGYDVRTLDGADRFEGTGDAVWHPNRELLWGGYGFRTDRATYDELAAVLDVPVITLELTDDRYYHLDLCFAPLDESTVLIQPEAFSGNGLSVIEQFFERVIEAPVEETTQGFACNCHSIDGENVAIAAGNPETTARIEDAGFHVHEVETGEFEKAGGSVQCLTLVLG